MANELSYQLQTLLSNGDLSDSFSVSSQSVDQSTALLIRNVQNIGTSAENLQIGDITTPGFAIFQNLDDTNFVEIGVDSGGFVAFVKLEPGEYALFRLGVTTPQAKADTASIDLFYIIYSD